MLTTRIPEPSHSETNGASSSSSRHFPNMSEQHMPLVKKSQNPAVTRVDSKLSVDSIITQVTEKRRRKASHRPTFSTTHASTSSPSASHTEDMKTRKEKREFLETLHKSRAKSIMLEREVHTHLSKSQFRSDFAPMFELETKAAEERKVERKGLHYKTSHIRDLVSRFINHVSKLGTGEGYIKDLKSLMEQSEEYITEIKNSQRDVYEKLLLDEKRMMQELMGMEERFKAWNQQDEMARTDTNTDSGNASKIVNRLTASSEDDPMLKEVRAFQDYLYKNGGNYGGWDDLSHYAFVKQRTRFGQTHPRFIASVIRHIPSMTMEDVQKHEEWYVGYLDLLEKKKKAIELWKEKRRVESNLAKDVLELDLEKDDDLVGSKKKKNQHFDDNESVVSEEEQKRRLEAMKKIEEWRTAQRKKQEEEQKAKEEARMKELEKEEKRRQEAERKKQILQKYQEQKIRDEEEAFKRKQEELELERKRKAQETTGRIKLMQMRDQEIVAKKLTVLESRKKAEEAKKERLEKLSSQLKSQIHVPNDPSRLLKPTRSLEKKFSKENMDEYEQSSKITNDFRPNLMPKRHVPTWRKGL